MNERSLELIKKDIVYILQLNAQINYDSTTGAQRALDTALEKNLFKTALGKKYLARLEDIINKKDVPRQCVLCGKPLDNDSLVCTGCMEKYKLTPPGLKTPAREKNKARPRLFLHALLALTLVTIFLYILTAVFQNVNAAAGLLLSGSAAMPVSALIFIYECDFTKRIGAYDLVKMTFAGAAACCLLLLILFELLPMGYLGYGGALLAACAEELIKLLLIIIFIKLIRPVHLLNGMLIGTAVGAGFSILENMSYSFRFFLLSGGSLKYLGSILLFKGLSSFGSHSVWGTMAGGALLLAMNGKPITLKTFYDKSFLKYFLLTIALHTVWDCPFMDRGACVYIKIVLLGILAWGGAWTLTKARAQTG